MRKPDSKRKVRGIVKKRLEMIGNKTTSGFHSAELEKLSGICDSVGIELPEWATLYKKMLEVAVRKGYMR